MTDQELFDTVARHLLAQGKPALAGTSCVYRAPDGCKCAAGALLPDEQYHVDLEGTPAPLVEYFRQTFPGQLALLNLLQEAHDGGGANPEFWPVVDGADFEVEEGIWLDRWKERMRHLAHVHNLNAEVLDAHA